MRGQSRFTADVILVIGIGRFLSRSQGRPRSAERSVPAVAQQAGKTDRSVRRTEPERRLPVRVARRHPFLQDRCNRHFKIGYHDRTAVAFRLIKNEIESRYGAEGAAKRIVAITDAARGALRTLATNEGYETFVIPDNIGGRYSVLTPVGLLPLAAAGINVDELVRGARMMRKLRRRMSRSKRIRR